MLAAWRGATISTNKPVYRPALYDDERQRARAAPAQAQALSTARPGRRCAQYRARLRKLGARQIEEMPSRPVLDLHDPDIGVEPDFFRKPFFHRRFRHRLQ